MLLTIHKIKRSLKDYEVIVVDEIIGMVDIHDLKHGTRRHFVRFIGNKYNEVDLEGLKTYIKNVEWFIKSQGITISTLFTNDDQDLTKLLLKYNWKAEENK